ncbi:cell envelope integrity protein CreD [Neptuniibacter halophilus]|uniref:cell envelope integrity protein CreD n=1 Tax=Neptuniibacter halophilus TaxID=651666 RepID=UPI002573723B|nr:cell envelope integrity protein CreD [Neptuniibacter halophilus]
MSKRITLKLILIGILALFLWIPLLLVQNVIYERMDYRAQVTRDIASKWTGQQTLSGPVIRIPWQLSYLETSWDDKNQQNLQHRKTLHGQYLLLPEQLSSEAVISNSTRHRGIYQIPVYRGDVQMSAAFSAAELQQHQAQLEKKYQGQLTWGTPELLLLISDMRGITSQPTATWQGTPLQFSAGSGMKAATQGIHTELPVTDLTGELELSLSLRGMEQLLLTPTAANSTIKMQSDWPHPSFSGRHLPESYEVDDNGFTALWQTSPFSADLRSVLNACSQENYCDLSSQSVGAEFIDPVDMYAQAERSLKYGLLFIAVSFMLFFLFEVLKKLPIHPIQYGMVGLALALFYLLLISLSEHIAFYQAYLIATLACCGLLAVYLSAVLKSLWRGCGFATGLAALYGLLYMIISAEGFALLMGSFLIFSCLTLCMLATRQIDWYQVNPDPRPKA